MSHSSLQELEQRRVLSENCSHKSDGVGRSSILPVFFTSALYHLYRRNQLKITDIVAGGRGRRGLIVLSKKMIGGGRKNCRGKIIKKGGEGRERKD